MFTLLCNSKILGLPVMMMLYFPEENHALQAQRRALKKANTKAEGDLTRVRYELSDDKSQHAAVLLEKTGQLEGVKARYQEEVGSLHTSYQLLMKGKGNFQEAACVLLA